MTEHASLIHLDKARQEIALATDMTEIKGLRDKYEAMRICYKLAGEGLKAQNEAAEAKIRAERAAGEILADIEREPGKRTDATSTTDGSRYAKTLRENNIKPTTAQNWQAIATLPDEAFEAVIATTKDCDRELTSAQMIRNAKRRKKDNGEPEPEPETEGLQDVGSTRQTNLVSDLVASMRIVTHHIQVSFKGWTASNRARLEKSLSEAIRMLKEQKP